MLPGLQGAGELWPGCWLRWRHRLRGATMPGVRLQEGEAVSMPEACLPTIPGYEVEAAVGRGGMGAVYRVRQQATGETLALKMLLFGKQAAFQELARFRVEAEALACLDHPNIVKVREVGIFAGCPFFLMEFAARGTLRQLAGT